MISPFLFFVLEGFIVDGIFYIFGALKIVNIV